MTSNENFLSKKEIKQKTWATRSIFTKKFLKKGQKIKKNDLIFLRPGNGIPVKNLNEIVGKKLKISVKAFKKLSYKNFSL